MELTLEQAATRLGVTPEELTRSQRRGVMPGNLAYARNGALFFDSTLLPPNPRGHRADGDAGQTRKERLQEEAARLGVPFTPKTTVADLEEKIREATGEEE